MISLSAIWVHAIVTIGSIGRPINIFMLITGKRFLVGIFQYNQGLVLPSGVYLSV